MLIQNREITHPDVRLLVRNAEDELLGLYPEQTPLPLDPHARFVVAYSMGEPVGCGALALVGDPGLGLRGGQAEGQRGQAVVAEVKRMYVMPAHRRTGVARRVLSTLERRAAGLGVRSLILETGTRNPAAIALYESNGFERTEPYGEYVGNPFSVCFFKPLPPAR